MYMTEMYRWRKILRICRRTALIPQYRKNIAHLQLSTVAQEETLHFVGRTINILENEAQDQLRTEVTLLHF